MSKRQILSRRDFLRLAGSGFGALLLPGHDIVTSIGKYSWPILRLEQLPNQIQEILDRVPETMITREGRLYLMDSARNKNGFVPLAQTLWNRENSFLSDRLYTSVPWGIVLHWYGDRDNYDKTITGYLRGFNSLRDVDGTTTRTSAHFLVAGHDPTTELEASEAQFGILQTQKPHANGTPFVSSHISGLDYVAHSNRKNYFVRAQYHLGYEEPGVHSIMQTWFDGGQNIDPNMRTISIEMTGYDFENRPHFPSKQQIANTISVVWALMRRYNITANNIFGHNEIQLNKPDPGKKFMAFMRLLLGTKAMLENDPQMNSLVFGNFLYEQIDTLQATQRYFKYVYDYLLMVSTPRAAYEWEGISGYWFLNDLLDNKSGSTPISRRFISPLSGEFTSPGRLFTSPTNHEGVDMHRDRDYFDRNDQLTSHAYLAADGECIYQGDFTGCCGGKTIIFRHRQRNGSQVLSVYGHLDALMNIKIGSQYPMKYPLGEIKQDLDHTDPFLHFAMAYGGTWNTDLRDQPSIPLNVGASWIRARYQHPFNLMDGGYGSPHASYSVT
jgi:hypothetical protein